MSNRLAHESSPYLLQHQDNPVDWYPWGEEAFRKARDADKPIFLSIGYATCHWCHVMEHESFEDEEVARLLNETFVCIKVDREERPDIDQVYMTVCQMVTGQGGWPLTILMTPDQQPFYAATYIPKQSRFNRIGMLDLVPRIRVAWQQDRAQIEDSAGQVAGSLRQVERATMAGAEPSEEWLQLTVKQLRQQYDVDEGGFGRAPKFPSPHKLLFLLRYWKSTSQQEALDMVRHTLVRMRQGGVFDHVGFGFHRYSTDAHWRLPHFEKMLYDQAMLAMAYTEAYHATGEAALRETAEEVITYVLRDLTAPDGGFYSAEDADSEGREGAFYVWTEDELKSVLGEDTGFAMRVFNVDPDGNFADEATGQKTGENILFLTDSVKTLAEREDVSVDAFQQRLERIRQILLAHREQRERPLLDDKILTDWNGLMIAALAQAARVFGNAHYRQAAERAAAFVLGTLRTDEGRLLHRYRAGQAGIQANLDDYAFLVWGLLELYETTFDVAYLQQAVALNEQMLAHFQDAERGGFYFPPDDGEALLIRSKEAYDGAIPSGNSIAMYNLIRLSRLLARPEYEDAAWQAAAAFGEAARRQPSGFCAMMMALGFATGTAQEIVIVGRAEAADTRALLDVVRTTYQPHKVVVLRPEDAGPLDALVDLIPLVHDQKPIDGSATAYVCENYHCQAPTTDPEVLRRHLTVGTG